MVLGRPSRSELCAGIGIEPPTAMPPAEVNASESLSYAEGVKCRSPGQGTASYRAVTPPWVVDPEFGGRACGVDFRGAAAETAMSHVVPLASGQHRMHHGQFGVPMEPGAAEIRGLTNAPRFARPGHRFHLVTGARFGLGKTLSIAASLARPIPWGTSAPRAARTFVALTSACPGLRCPTPSA